MIDVLVLWLWYLLAFALGIAAMWFVLARVVPARSADEALDDAFERTHRVDEGDEPR